ncbi:hypothetical protein DA103_09120 [Enterobacter cloacae]|uniref:Uncharacterized protein n=1 Tax=Enterobacter cloacae TaxID=550 RepID=A0A2T4Y170_ENTCL|nr:hypothetical protein [Enterobacter cloacae]PTM35929.1 hypothetical protein DA103_09120 [Enterobacter cloacae]
MIGSLLWVGAIACVGCVAWAHKKDKGILVIVIGLLGVFLVCKAVESRSPVEPTSNQEIK